MMNRRFFLGTGAAFAMTSAIQTQNCGVLPSGMTVCTAEVDMQQLLQAISTQQCPEWCWAACISMIFGFYGHPIDQREIVRQTYGNVVCLPAGFTRTIGQDLSRAWTDANGDLFQSRVVAAFDPANNIFAINNAIIVNELENDHPLLYCNKSHAMLIYAVDYVPTQAGPNIIAVGVVDPWPYNQRLHLLNPAEMVPVPWGDMTFLATIRHQEM